MKTLGFSDDFDLYISVALTGSFSETGRVFEMPASSVMRRINNLEEKLETRLINRSTKKLVLTETGALFLKHARKISENINQARNEIKEHTSSTVGTLRVSAPVAFLPATYRTTGQHTAEKESRPQTGFLPERQDCRSRRGKTRSLHPSRHPAGQQPDLLEAGGATPGALRQPGIPAEAWSATHPGRTRTAHLPATQRLQQRLIELAVQQRRHYQANQDLAGQPPVREQCRAPGGRSLARLGDHSCADLAGPRRSGQRQAGDLSRPTRSAGAGTGWHLRTATAGFGGTGEDLAVSQRAEERNRRDALLGPAVPADASSIGRLLLTSASRTTTLSRSTTTNRVSS